MPKCNHLRKWKPQQETALTKRMALLGCVTRPGLQMGDLSPSFLEVWSHTINYSNQRVLSWVPTRVHAHKIAGQSRVCLWSAAVTSSLPSSDAGRANVSFQTSVESWHVVKTQTQRVPDQSFLDWLSIFMFVICTKYRDYVILHFYLKLFNLILLSYKIR